MSAALRHRQGQLWLKPKDIVGRAKMSVLVCVLCRARHVLQYPALPRHGHNPDERLPRPQGAAIIHAAPLNCF